MQKKIDFLKVITRGNPLIY